MKIAVTSQNRRAVTGHAGRCRKFWVFEAKDKAIVGRELLELPKEQCLHDMAPGMAEPLEAIDVLISEGMGSGSCARLARKGIKVVVTHEKGPERAVRLWLAGELGEVSAGGDCRH